MLFVLKIGNECFMIILVIIKPFILLILNFYLFKTSKMHVTSKWKMKRFQLLDFLVIWLALPIQMDFGVYHAHLADPEKPWIQYYPHKARKRELLPSLLPLITSTQCFLWNKADCICLLHGSFIPENSSSDVFTPTCAYLVLMLL